MPLKFKYIVNEEREYTVKVYRPTLESQGLDESREKIKELSDKIPASIESITLHFQGNDIANAKHASEILKNIYEDKNDEITIERKFEIKDTTLQTWEDKLFGIILTPVHPNPFFMKIYSAVFLKLQAQTQSEAYVSMDQDYEMLGVEIFSKNGTLKTQSLCSFGWKSILDKESLHPELFMKLLDNKVE